MQINRMGKKEFSFFKWLGFIVAVIVSRVAATPPTVILVVPVRFVPVITVEVPPKVEPALTEIEL